eukprot:4108862-Amphidinium_carterae.1
MASTEFLLHVPPVGAWSDCVAVQPSEGEDQRKFALELLAADARLSGCLREAGYHAAAVDARHHKHVFASVV